MRFCIVTIFCNRCYRVNAGAVSYTHLSVHYGDPELCVAEIAEHLGISEGHLSHTFKRETDYTVAAYITLSLIHILWDFEDN